MFAAGDMDINCISGHQTFLKDCYLFIKSYNVRSNKFHQNFISYKILTLHKFHLVALVFWGLFMNNINSTAQVSYLPYSYQFYQKFNREAYSSPANFHTSLKPFVISDFGAMQQKYDSLMTPRPVDTLKGLIYQLWFNRHLLSESNKDYTIYFDILPDVLVGQQLNPKVGTSLNTRGVQMGGTVGKNFFFYSSLYENQARFADYINKHINFTLPPMVPGQAYDRSLPKSDWAYVTGLIGYKINSNISVQMGEDKTFIGDGYRSVLLSDNAAPYPLLRLNVNVRKNIQYTAMWAYLEDNRAPQFNSFYNWRRKWGAFHYIDWNINQKASLGFFNAIITQEANDSGVGHGFDLNYINPILFTSSIQPSNTKDVLDHTLLGLNAKYNLLKKTTLYGQFLIDQTTQISFGKRNAWQIGIRGSDLFTLSRLNYLFEYNTAKPYTYSNNATIVNYAHFSESLAHPFGANFKEFVALLNYSIKRFDFQIQFENSKQGLDKKANNVLLNYGSNIVRANNANLPSGDINTTGQGLATTLNYLEGVVSYLINPKYNLRIELSGLIREQKNTLITSNTTLISLGLRSSFRNIYHDF